jgi:multiple sugar transport system permease protein
MPAAEYDWVELQAHHSEVQWEFVWRNYAIVLDYVLRHGHALWNTVIYCVLAIVTALIVNPLAAYALSRYQLPSQYKILFFLMATMAFPAEVTMIPNFLLLKDFDMLNTFWALILPGAANGYAIFLLKGFFDSLPRELYESAMIDGASEWRMFWGITMALSKPILAVIALGAFTGAYGAFMQALLVCQDEKMWTIMVYLYQLQQRFAQPVVFASLLVAAVPTLLVFVFCQNIIMRGIVVPVEK